MSASKSNWGNNCNCCYLLLTLYMMFIYISSKLVTNHFFKSTIIYYFIPLVKWREKLFVVLLIFKGKVGHISRLGGQVVRRLSRKQKIRGSNPRRAFYLCDISGIIFRHLFLGSKLAKYQINHFLSDAHYSLKSVHIIYFIKILKH